jgi:proline dehydrogenase
VRLDVVAVDRAVLFRLATSERLERIVKAVPGGDAQASRYVAGRSRDEGLMATVDLLAQGQGVSVDLFGELVRDQATADRVTEDYLALAAALPDPPTDVWLSLDLSHLAIDTDPAGAADRLATIAAALPPGRRIQVGAEDAARIDAALRCVLVVAGRGLANRLGATVQANLLRSERDVDTLTAARVHVRLVKGAYLEPTGTHPYGEPTDITYLRLGFRLHEAGAAWSMATHDGRLREALLLALGPVPVEQLLGVRLDTPPAQGTRSPDPCLRPYGPDWFRYWLRRLAESRGA